MKSLKYFSPTFKLIVSSLVGSFIGMVTSLMVNCTLLEISMNNVFSIYFGIIFIIVGSLFLWRSLAKGEKQKREGAIFHNGKVTPGSIKYSHSVFVAVLSILVVLSGFTSFILDQSWFLLINYVYKIPIYSLLGVSICFTLSFLVIDIINYLSTACHYEYSRPIISTPNQFSFILYVSCILGIIYGMIFGVMDLEDLSKAYLQAAFIREQNFCIPIGLGFGCITGYMNEYIGSESKENEYQSLSATFNEEI